MSAVGTIAWNVFRESVRDKVLYNLVLFAIGLMSASYLLGQLTAGQEVKIIKDLGLAAMSLIGLFIAVFIGIGLVSKEVERKSIYALLAKPMTRSQFVLGKYAGLVLTLAVNLAIMTVAYYAVLGYWSLTEHAWYKAGWDAPGADPNLLKPVFLILVELSLVTAIALLFSTFSSPMLSAALTFGLYIVGHFNEDLRHFETIVPSHVTAFAARALYYLLPNLAAFDVSSTVVHGRPVPFGYLAVTTAYAVVYIAALLAGAAFIFSRRDFK